MQPSITLYGFGYVGKAISEFLSGHFRIQIVDPRPSAPMTAEEKRWHIRNRKKVVRTPSAIIAVPTAMKKGGACDVSIVESVVRESRHGHYLIKSTVIPGTTERLKRQTGKRIVFSPEYIGEGNYEIPHWKGFPHPKKMKLHEFFIFGGSREDTARWIGIWQKVAGWAPRYLETDSTTAEIVKYAENGYLATQKMFWDQLYDLVCLHKRSYHEVRELLLSDKRISPALSVIYPDSRGFGGKCLPKDLSAIVHHMASLGADPHFFRSILASNESFRHTNPAKPTA